MLLFPKALPFFSAMVILEFLIMVAKGKNRHTVFYTFTNVTGGMLEQLFNKLCVKPFFFLLYCYLYEHYKICELPWNSVWTWYFVFMTVDFFYYWFHRSSHGMFLLCISITFLFFFFKFHVLIFFTSPMLKFCQC